MTPHDERLLDLMALRATEGLDFEADSELSRLAEADPETDVESFDYVAAAIHLALIEPEIESMPDEVRRSLEQLPIKTALEPVRNAAPAKSTDTSPAPIVRSAFWSQAGWIAAAAMLIVTLLTFTSEPTSQLTMRGSEGDRSLAKLEAEASDLVRWNWSSTGAAKDYEAVGGEVVWSEARQEGYMVLKGLPVNDPRKQQYQLWIVDGRKGADGKPRYAHPVDGGVFDVTSNDEVVVPIDAKLASRDVAAFVLTMEEPGGVVVSAGPHLVLAKR
ncbi:MAG: anti-sigma factor [Planctomycetota bacterium]